MEGVAVGNFGFLAPVRVLTPNQMAAIQQVVGIHALANLRLGGQTAVKCPGIFAALDLYTVGTVNVDADIQRQTPTARHGDGKVRVIEAIAGVLQRIDVRRKLLVGSRPGHDEIAEEVLCIAGAFFQVACWCGASCGKRLWFEQWGRRRQRFEVGKAGTVGEIDGELLVRHSACSCGGLNVFSSP